MSHMRDVSENRCCCDNCHTTQHLSADQIGSFHEGGGRLHLTASVRIGVRLFHLLRGLHRAGRSITAAAGWSALVRPHVQSRSRLKPSKATPEGRGRPPAKHGDSMLSSGGLSSVVEQSPKQTLGAETEKLMRIIQCKGNGRHRARTARVERLPDCRKAQTGSSRSTTHTRTPTQEMPARQELARATSRRKMDLCSVAWRRPSTKLIDRHRQESWSVKVALELSTRTVRLPSGTAVRALVRPTRA